MSQHPKGFIKGLSLIPIAQNQLVLSMCVKQAITLHGMILQSLPLTINSSVWKPGISMQALVPYIEMTEVTYLPQEYLHFIGR